MLLRPDRAARQQIPTYPDGFRSPRPGSAGIARQFSTFPRAQGLAGYDEGLVDQWLAGLRVQPLSAVEWRWQEGWGVGPRRLKDSMWFWFESVEGWGWVGTRENSFRLRSGDALLIPEGVEHFIRQKPGTTSHLIAVHFRASVLDAVDLLDLLGYPTHMQAERCSAIFGPRSQRLAQEYGAKPTGWATAMTGILQDLLLTLLQEFPQEFEQRSEKRTHADLPRLLPALHCLEVKLDDPQMSVATLAETVHLGEVQFRKLFRRVTGASPVQFIRRQRIRKACNELIVHDASVEEVAKRCGFGDVRFFRRAFRQLTGYTPGSFRRNGRENPGLLQWEEQPGLV